MTDKWSGEDKIWNLYYNLKRNPFSTDPISISDENSDEKILIETFVGRNKEFEDFTKQLRSGNETRTVIFGDSGVGKTSFVNHTLYLLENKYFYISIDTKSGWDEEKFLANTLFAILNTLNKKDNKILRALKIAGKITAERVLEMIIGSSALINLKDTINHNEKNLKFGITSTFLESSIESIIRQIFNKYKKEIVIIYDNCENLTDYYNYINELMNKYSDTKNMQKREIQKIAQERSISKITQFFNDIKSIFQISHVHFVFVGNLIFYNVMQRVSGFSSIFTFQIFLEPMKLKDINSVLEIRLEKMKTKKEKPKLYDDGVLSMLYDVYEGNIKNILSKLDNTITSYTFNNSITLNVDILINMFKKDLDNVFSEYNVKTTAKKILYAIACANRGEANTKLLKKPTKLKRMETITETINNTLEPANLVTTRYDGKDIFVSIEQPEMRWKILNLIDPNDLK